MSVNRRTFLERVTLAAAGLVASKLSAAESTSTGELIIDTHQHLWDLSQLTLPWLKSAPEVLRKNYGPKEYAEATHGLNIRAVYMEVDVATSDHDKEAEYVIGLSRSGKGPTIAAVIGGRPASADFEAYLKRHLEGGYVKGVRQVLHGEETPRGTCLKDDFVRGVRTLGKHQLMFDLCMRPTELQDAKKLTELCPDTQFVLDHCGNADVKAFNPSLSREKADHQPDDWRRDIDAIAGRPNVICKISGIVASAPSGWKTEHLASIVNHCLDAFGPERVVFGGDWPVCLLGSPLRQWVDALREIVASRSDEQRAKLWHQNAQRIYRLNS